jgi:hypothetical protein
MDLVDLYRGRLSYRKLGVLIDHLPPESATITAIRSAMTDEELTEWSAGGDPAKGRWSSLEMLIAALLDEVRRFEHMYVSAHVKKGQSGPAPAPVPRPGISQKTPARRRSRLTDEQRRMLDPRLRLVPDPGEERPA